MQSIQREEALALKKQFAVENLSYAQMLRSLREV